MRDREAGNVKLNRNRSKWEKADWYNYLNEEMKENVQKGQILGAGEVDRGGEGNPWVENKIKKTGCGTSPDNKECEES